MGVAHQAFMGLAAWLAVAAIAAFLAARWLERRPRR